MTGLAAQGFRFGLVGLAATAAHFCSAVGLVEAVGLPVQVASFAAFCIAFGVSYVGNHAWTFRGAGPHASHAPRFLAIALGGLALNQTIVWAVHDVGGRDYRLALLAVILIVPPVTFFLSRYWAFSTPLPARAGTGR